MMSDHLETSTIPIYAHHSDPHENIVKCNFPQGSMQKLIRLQCHWYCEVVLVQINPCPCGNYNSGLFWGPGV